MSSRRYVLFGWIFLGMVALWVYVFMLGIHRGLPFSVVPDLPLEPRLFVEQWFPQGWGFYSKNPRDSYFYVVRMPDHQLPVGWPNNSLSNIFGISRFGRAQGIEAGLIASEIPNSAYVFTNVNPLWKLDELKPELVIKNPSPSPTILGDIGIIYQPPVPWAWTKEADKIIMPSRVARVIVK
ncbi:SdpA family antimicrobial peptide system protein [Kyrpidia spormannii]|uniref:SdpA family antimicrobial peptide system protein n=1 Tax=Kyrpidia spormannii TaxID=2055160 RepID=A0A2K8N570_9BACL|nr:SdpA family antimicrobial peptide system protein [Kyrpidia spormannii]ATY84484.1 SdpA family antimicrobial peptide system protein [Kyrpidia spormannii]